MSKNRRNVRKTVSKGENIKKVVAMKNYGQFFYWIYRDSHETSTGEYYNVVKIIIAYEVDTKEQTQCSNLAYTQVVAKSQ